MHVLIRHGVEAIDTADGQLLAVSMGHQCSFLEKHLGAWAPAFADKVIEHARTDHYRRVAAVYAPDILEKGPRQLAAYRRMPDSVLFRVQRVRVHLDECDLPGPTRRKVVCSVCGQTIRDRREAWRDDRPVCRPCAGDGYFSNAREVAWPEMNGCPQTTSDATVGGDDGDGARRLIALH
jgi:hypothetical protein